ncbi:B3 domain-containing protein REM17-like isoform X1 [Lycium ferocissimum]|uniref:B3 domain-containing protein REM17-like isoform X1 n=1 Tax=Lycium ferocissimum TaxID=112874 RepID=UPI00281689C2|nr:B3 domain-containing protein REM17-like isoform X1 [Lycium ferocissimum]
MKVPPKKPHFFKPILPGFKHGMKIPIGFLKYLKGHDQYEHAILRRADKKWLVKVNGSRLEEGDWKDFVEQHDLQLGDILVFKHERDMIFEVSIFDSSHCDREYMHEEETAKKFYLKEKPQPDITSSSKAVPNVEDAKGLNHSPSHFICTMKSYCISKCFLPVPSPFARLNGLRNRRCAIIIIDEQRLWTFRLYFSGYTTNIGGGWRNFCFANCLKEADRLMFETIANGEKPILKFRDLRGNASLQPEGKQTNLDTERVSTQDLRGNASLYPEGNETNLHARRVSTGEKPTPNIMSSGKAVPDVESASKGLHLSQSHFICTMKSYCLSKCFLQLPSPFARLNGLRNRKCAIMIRDEQRSWTFRLYSSGRHTCIAGGWRDFCIANGLKEGDRVMFGVVANGEKPTLKFHGKYLIQALPLNFIQFSNFVFKFYESFSLSSQKPIFLGVE